MSSENENTPDASDETPIRRKGGRPKGSKNKVVRLRKDGVDLKRQHKYQMSLTECFREGMHPELMLEYYKIILRGQTPVLEIVDGQECFVPDPNPLLPSPTLEQRNAAAKAIADRGYGLPAQSVNIEHEYRTKVELQLTGLSADQFGAIDLNKLFAIREMFKLPAPNNETNEISDAELVNNDE